MVKLYGIDPPTDLFQERLEMVKDLMAEYWMQLIQSGHDIVLDFGFWTREEETH